jgi:hypothetical protein
MRAMRQILALCALVFVAGGCGDDTTSFGPDMSSPADLTAGPDLAVRMPDGVVCGASSCSVGQSCCVSVTGTTTSAMCLAPGGTCNGAKLACDGPEDCSSGMQFCCGMITFSGGTNPDAGAPMFNGGNASCNGTCDFNFTQGPPSQVTTRLCHADVDCTGLSLGGQVMLDKCCSSTMAPGLHFCAAALGFGGITCP